MALLLKVLLDLIGLSHIHIYKNADTFAARWLSALHCHLIAMLLWVQFARSPMFPPGAPFPSTSRDAMFGIRNTPSIAFYLDTVFKAALISIFILTRH